MEWWAVYALVGAGAGLAAGLFGIGGGVVVVPCLVLAFQAQGISDKVVIPLAVGTSLAAIVLTALSSVRAHHVRGAVRWTVVRALAPWLALGAGGAAWFAARLSSVALAAILAGFLGIVATRLLYDKSPRPPRPFPSRPVQAATGWGIGFVSGVVGIGGGTLCVPYLLRHGVDMVEAIGTAAAAGVPIAIAGATAYAIIGAGVVGIPGPSAGFVYVPALVGVAAASVLAAPVGARLAHRAPTRRLKIGFALLLYVVGAKLALGVWSA